MGFIVGYVIFFYSPFFFIMFRKCKMGYTYENWYFKKCSKIIKVLFILISIGTGFWLLSWFLLTNQVFCILVAYAVIIFRVSEKIATIGTRFRFKISIHFYSFSYTIFYVSICFLFLKNLYLSKQSRVPIKNNNTL